MTTRVKINNIILSILLGITLFLIFSERIYSLQTSVPWSPLRRVPEYLDDTFPPVMIADQNKTVHAFVSQWVGEEAPLKAIVYRQWSANIGWTAPIDILLPPNGETQVYSAFIDQSGIMHLLFRAGEATGSGVYYSSAFVEDMDRATVWSEPEIIGENAMFPGSGSIVGDEYGNLVIIYNGTQDGNGVYAVHSHDSGISWSDAKPIFLTFDPELVPFSLQSIKGNNNQGHAVWSVVTNKGVDFSLHYANFNFESSDWNTSVILDERIEKDDFFGPAFPAIVDNGQSLIVMYNSGNPEEGGQVNPGRPVQRVRQSDDEGETWRDSIGPFPRHLGRSGSHALVVDGDHAAHALFIQRIEPGIGDDYAPIGGLWHSIFANDQWSEPELFDLEDMSGHDVSAVVSQGNELLVTFREDPGVAEKGIWNTSTVLSANELPVIVPEVMTPIPTIMITTTDTAEPVIQTLSPGLSTDPLQEGIPAGATNNPAKPILISLIPVVVVISLIVFYRKVRQKP